MQMRRPTAILLFVAQPTKDLSSTNVHANRLAAETLEGQMAKEGPEGFLTDLLLRDQGGTVVSVCTIDPEGMQGAVGERWLRAVTACNLLRSTIHRTAATKAFVWL